jgi:hypothetical protein
LRHYLVTVLEHELGHVLGLPDNAEAGDLMDITIGLGVRRAPGIADLAAIPFSAGNHQTRQSSPLTGPVSQAMVDVALWSLQSSASGNGESNDPAVGNGARGMSIGRDSSIAVRPTRKNRVTQAARPHPHVVLWSLFTQKIRRPGQASTNGLKDSANEQRD